MGITGIALRRIALGCDTTHFLRPVNFDVVADARVVRIGRNTSFGRVMLLNAADRRPIGMVASAYAVL